MSRRNKILHILACFSNMSVLIARLTYSIVVPHFPAVSFRRLKCYIGIMFELYWTNLPLEQHIGSNYCCWAARLYKNGNAYIHLNKEIILQRNDSFHKMKIILFSFLFFVTFLPSALACRCPPRGRSGTIQQSYYARSTRAVFRAKVVSISGPCQTCTFRNQGQKRTFSLEIEQIYKGCPPSPTAITVQSFIRPPFCDFSLSTGSVYLFSTPQGIVPTIGSCNVSFCIFIMALYYSHYFYY